MALWQILVPHENSIPRAKKLKRVQGTSFTGPFDIIGTYNSLAGEKACFMKIF